ncbi:hypothetical protein DIPPA_16174 [Diplonema papillatum]|nr:hypothetical protein DIPPA_16174 [Diplonema papillatum]|eukprot:gene15895-24296_t
MKEGRRREGSLQDEDESKVLTVAHHTTFAVDRGGTRDSKVILAPLDTEAGARVAGITKHSAGSQERCTSRLYRPKQLQEELEASRRENTSDAVAARAARHCCKVLPPRYLEEAARRLHMKHPVTAFRPAAHHRLGAAFAIRNDGWLDPEYDAKGDPHLKPYWRRLKKRRPPPPSHALPMS